MGRKESFHERENEGKGPRKEEEQGA